VAPTNECLLALEWNDLELATRDTEALLGQRLANQHRYTAEQFGWKRDNTIGSTLQQSNWRDDWVRFYAERRPGYQLDLAAKNGYAGALQNDGRRLLDNLGYYFSDYWLEASLLHGDIWAATGLPVRANRLCSIRPSTAAMEKAI
jgi:fructosamine-3-kinase